MIRGLTLWQPMAWAIAAGHKRIENRPWAPWRGVTHLAIHAGATYHRPHAEQITEHFGIEVPARRDLVFGAILCVVRLNGFVHEDDDIDQPEHDDPWFSGPFGWKLSDVQRLETPIPRKGMQGLWRLTDDDLVELNRQLTEGAPWGSQ